MDFCLKLESEIMLTFMPSSPGGPCEEKQLKSVIKKNCSNK